VFSDTAGNAALTPPATIAAVKEIDFRSYQSDVPIKRFYNTSKFFASKGIEWISTAPLSGYPTALTYIVRPSLIFNTGVKLGIVHVTYYVMFKGG